MPVPSVNEPNLKLRAGSSNRLIVVVMVVGLVVPAGAAAAAAVCDGIVVLERRVGAKTGPVGKGLGDWRLELGTDGVTWRE